MEERVLDGAVGASTRSPECQDCGCSPELDGFVTEVLGRVETWKQGHSEGIICVIRKVMLERVHSITWKELPQ